MLCSSSCFFSFWNETNSWFRWRPERGINSCHVALGCLYRQIWSACLWRVRQCHMQLNRRILMLTKTDDLSDISWLHIDLGKFLIMWWEYRPRSLHSVTEAIYLWLLLFDSGILLRAAITLKDVVLELCFIKAGLVAGSKLEEAPFCHKTKAFIIFIFTSHLTWHMIF